MTALGRPSLQPRTVSKRKQSVTLVVVSHLLRNVFHIDELKRRPNLPVHLQRRPIGFLDFRNSNVIGLTLEKKS